MWKGVIVDCDKNGAAPSIVRESLAPVFFVVQIQPQFALHLTDRLDRLKGNVLHASVHLLKKERQ